MREIIRKRDMVRKITRYHLAYSHAHQATRTPSSSTIQTARSDSDFARQVAEYAFHEVTVGATTSGVSGASPQLLEGEFKENKAVGIEGSSHRGIRTREGKRGDGVIESVPRIEGVPRPKGKARRVGDQTNRAGARAGMGPNAAGGTSVGHENGESVGSKGLKVLLHHPPVDGSSPAGSDSEIDMMDFLEEAAQLLDKGEAKEEVCFINLHVSVLPVPDILIF